MIKVRQQRVPRVCQGDIYRDVEFIEYISEKRGFIELSKITFPLVVVLTQDCDLQQDYTVRWSKKVTNDDKMLFSVLVAPLYNLEHFRAGEHLLDLDRKMQRINSDAVRLVKSNQNPRYHYVEFPQDVPIVPSVIDFKHYFSLNVEHVKRAKPKHFVCKIAEVYREDISQRFASFLSRIGLPDIPPNKTRSATR
jgi:hypothetical protein